MDRLNQGLDLFELSEEVGVLQNDGGGIVGEGRGEGRWIDRAPRRGDGDQLRAPGAPAWSPRSAGTRDGPFSGMTTRPNRLVMVSAMSTASLTAEPPS